jgi:hypothetical protein
MGQSARPRSNMGCVAIIGIIVVIAAAVAFNQGQAPSGPSQSDIAANNMRNVTDLQAKCGAVFGRIVNDMLNSNANGGGDVIPLLADLDTGDSTCQTAKDTTDMFASPDDLISQHQHYAAWISKAQAANDAMLAALVAIRGYVDHRDDAHNRVANAAAKAAADTTGQEADELVLAKQELGISP